MKQQLNSLVGCYQRTEEEVYLREIFKQVNPIIERASRELEHLITDVTKFDCRVVLKAKKLIESFDEDKHDYLAAVKAIVSREKADFIRRRRSKLEETSLDALASGEGSEEGDGLGYQFKSSENVVGTILLNEKIALLAQGDSRKKVILNEWSKGADDKSISELLAQRFGGKAESHRKFITRFKTDECCPFFLKDGYTLKPSV